MDFLFERDWLGRAVDNSVNFLFAPEYIIFFVIATLTAIILPILLRRVSPKTVRTVLICMWAFALAIDVVRWSIGWIYDSMNGTPLNVGSGLPLHTCSMLMITAPLAIFLKDGKIKTAFCNYVCTINLFGGLVGMFAGTAMMWTYSMVSFYGPEHMIYHAIAIILPLIMLVTGFYKPKKHDMWLGLLVFLAVSLPVFIFDNIVAVDYMYIYDGSTLEPFKAIANAMPHRLVWTLVAVAGYVAITALLQFIAIGVRVLHDKVKKAK